MFKLLRKEQIVTNRQTKTFTISPTTGDAFHNLKKKKKNNNNNNNNNKETKK